MLRFQPAGSASRPQPPSPLFPPPIAGEGRGGDFLSAAFEAMDHRRIRYAFRKGSEHVIPDAPGSEVDILIDRLELRAAERALREQGFHRLDAPGSPRHRFYLAFDRGRWLKIDAKLARGSSATTRSGRHWEAGEHVLTALAQRRPLGLRRAGPVVALLGPDGAGKGTVIEALKARIPAGLTVVYLGERRRNSPRPRNAMSARCANAPSSATGPHGSGGCCCVATSRPGAATSFSATGIPSRRWRSARARRAVRHGWSASFSDG